MSTKVNVESVLRERPGTPEIGVEFFSDSRGVVVGFCESDNRHAYGES